MATTRDELEVFLWEGKDKRGKVLKGERSARNQTLIRAELRKQGITPSRVRKKPKPLFGGAGKSISARDIAVFTRQLATLTHAGPRSS